MASSQIRTLAEKFDQLKVELDPLAESIFGSDRAPDRLPDLTLDTHHNAATRLRALVNDADSVTPDLLDDTDRATRAVLLHEAATLATSLEDGAVELTLGGGLSPLSTLLVALPKTASASNESDYRSRVEAVGPFLAQATDRFAEAAARGRQPLRRAVQRTVDQLDVILAADASMFRAPFATSEAVMRAVDTALLPAFKKFRQVLHDQLLPVARSDAEGGLGNIPHGEELYAHAVAEHTTTSRTPEQVHCLGQELCAALRDEYEALGNKVLGLRRFGDIVDRLRHDPGLRYQNADEIEADAKAALTRAEQAVPDWFGMRHRTPCDVLPMSEVEAPTGTLAYYQPAAPEVGRHGTYWINTYKPDLRTRYEYEALTFHESVPGHHLQFSLNQEMVSLPTFRRHLYVAAFSEGWGLYSERLCDEMGLYSSDLARFGMLSFDSWRACRLVVDTGIHALGWTRQQAIDFMLANSALTLINIENEVDRYIAWPGQSLAYMSGRLEIDRLRAHAQQTLGARFDIRDFHDAVLGNGGVPLTVLGEIITRWVATANA